MAGWLASETGGARAVLSVSLTLLWLHGGHLALLIILQMMQGGARHVVCYVVVTPDVLAVQPAASCHVLSAQCNNVKLAVSIQDTAQAQTQAPACALLRIHLGAAGPALGQLAIRMPFEGRPAMHDMRWPGAASSLLLRHNCVNLRHCCIAAWVPPCQARGFAFP